MLGLPTMFRRPAVSNANAGYNPDAVLPGTTLQSLGSAPIGSAYTTDLGRSNTISEVGPVVGNWQVPGSYGTWQQPAMPPPAPVPGFKSIAPQQPIVPTLQANPLRFSPAPHVSPYGVTL